MKLRTRLFEHVLRQQHPCHQAIPYVIEAGYMNERQRYQLNPLNHLFMLRHPCRFWFASLAVALVSAVVPGPWLVFIPLVARGLLVAPGELLDELCGKAVLQAADKNSVPGRKL